MQLFIDPPALGWAIVAALAVTSISAGFIDARKFRPTASFPILLAVAFFLTMRLYFDDRALIYLLLFTLLAAAGEWLGGRKEKV
ncbi:hypothetical protein WG915_10270 [Corynebacterium sp. H128]|uniref:hypothetical protein n=1 Tax=Corynebacterium sp. H128 TaxID=3133427 RepID=UPI00309F19BA